MHEGECSGATSTLDALVVLFTLEHIGTKATLSSELLVDGGAYVGVRAFVFFFGFAIIWSECSGATSTLDALVGGHPWSNSESDTEKRSDCEMNHRLQTEMISPRRETHVAHLSFHEREQDRHRGGVRPVPGRRGRLLRGLLRVGA